MGWIFVGIGFLFLNGFLFFHYKNSKNKNTYQVVHLGMIGISAIYFWCFFTGRTDSTPITILSYCSSFYLVLLLYSAILFLGIDLYYFIKNHSLKRETNEKVILLFLFSAAIISIYGILHGTTLKLTEYPITLKQKESSIQTLNAIMISDLHVGASIKQKQLNNLKKKVELEKPNIVFLTGDIFDEGTPNYLKHETIQILSSIYAKYGIFYITGNHEYNVGGLNDLLNQMRNSGIQVLMDEVVLVQNQFYVIGRIDAGQKRLPLSTLLNQASSKFPIILLDHRPSNEGWNNGEIDLQLSGHTHNGQIVPFSITDLFTGHISYGKKSSNHSSIIVTSGTGTWAIPSRVGSTSELVKLNITFQ